MATEKYVTGGINVLKCKDCQRDDPRGFAWIPITLEELASFRANDGGYVKGTCLNGHTVMFIIKTRPMSLTNQHAREMLNRYETRREVTSSIMGA